MLVSRRDLPVVIRGWASALRAGVDRPHGVAQSVEQRQQSAAFPAQFLKGVVESIEALERVGALAHETVANPGRQPGHHPVLKAVVSGISPGGHVSPVRSAAVTRATAGSRWLPPVWLGRSCPAVEALVVLAAVVVSVESKLFDIEVGFIAVAVAEAEGPIEVVVHWVLLHQERVQGAATPMRPS